MSLLSLIVVIPLIGALVILAIPGTRTKLIQGVALVTSAACLFFTGYLYAAFDKAVVTMQFVEKFSWIPAFNIHYYIGVDGLSVALVTLTGLLTMLAIVYSFNITLRIKEFFFWFLLLEVGMLGVFISLDFFLFYVFWELTLVPMYFLIGVWGGPKKEYAAIKFFLYTLFGSLLMLLGILALYFNSTPHTFDMLELINQARLLPLTMQIWIFLALYVGFAIKIPAFPFHTWLPLAHVEAPTGVSVILAGVLLKMGTYGIMRVSFPALPLATKWFMPFLIIIAVINIVYGAFCAMAQKDLKKMVAYSSISHMGFVLLGFATLSQVGIVAGVFTMFAHGLVTAVLFMMCGVMQHKCGTRLIPMLGGLSKRMPIAATLMTAGFLASLGLPGLVSFAAEFMVFYATFVKWSLWVLVPIVAVAVTAAYYLWALQRSMFGPMTDRIDTSHLKDMDWFEYVPVAALMALIAVFGVFPGLIFSRIDSAVEIVMRLFGGG